MKDPSDAMQAAVYAKMIAAAAVTALVGARIYDKVPGEPGYPYCRIGEDQAVGDSNSCADGWEFFATVHSFSRHAISPRPEAKQVNNAVVGALADDSALPAPAGFAVTLSEMVQSRTFMEDDGVTAHGVVTIRYLIADAA